MIVHCACVNLYGFDVNFSLDYLMSVLITGDITSAHKSKIVSTVCWETHGGLLYYGRLIVPFTGDHSQDLDHMMTTYPACIRNKATRSATLSNIKLSS